MSSKFDRAEKVRPLTANANCGRAPHGRCVGWHKLSESEYEYLLRFLDLELLPMDKRFSAYTQREIAKRSAHQSAA